MERAEPTGNLRSPPSREVAASAGPLVSGESLGYLFTLRAPVDERDAARLEEPVPV
jgi:hypothetical protein